MFFVLNLHPQSSTAGLWCNGNTADFGSVVLGSSPSRPTKNLSDLRGFFIYNRFVLNLESNDWSLSMIDQIFTNTSIKEMRKSFSSMCAHSN